MPAAIIVSAIGLKGATLAVATLVAGAIDAYIIGKVVGQPQPLTNRKVVARSATSNRTIIYGESQVAGTLVFAEVTNDKKYLHLVQVLAAHEVEEIGDVYFNDTISTDSRFDNFYRINKHLGAPNQPADADLVREAPSWQDNMTLQGLAYIYVRLEASIEVWDTGIPTIRTVVKGKKVRDPRTGNVAWSDNWALCLADYISEPIGLGALPEELSDENIAAAANICDEPVPTSSGNQARYSINGVVDLGNTPIDVIESMSAAAAGFVTYTQGIYRLIPGSYTPPIITFSEKDLIGDLSVVASASRADRVNKVKGVYINKEEDWQTTDFPPVYNLLYETEDGGEELARDIKLEYTTDSIAAQRIARVTLERARQDIQVNLSVTYRGLQVAVGDTVALNIDNLGWEGKEFRVLTSSLSDSGGVVMQLAEEAEQSYDWNQGFAFTSDIAPNTNLPPASDVGEPADLVLASGSEHLLVAGDGTITSRIFASWVEASDAFVLGYEVEFKNDIASSYSSTLNQQTAGNNTDWVSLGRTSNTNIYIAPVVDGNYYSVRVRSVNFRGNKSDWITVFSHRVLGKIDPPSNVDSFSVIRQPDGTREYSWEHKQPPVDLAGYRIRFRRGATLVPWESMAPLVEGIITETPFESNQLAAGAYSLAIKAVDTSGIESIEPVFLTANLGDPRIGESVFESNETTEEWPYTKIRSWVDTDNTLVPFSSVTWDTLPDRWDDWRINFANGEFNSVIVDRFGYSSAISADGSTMVAGAYLEGPQGSTGSSFVYIFDRVNDTYDFDTARRIIAFDAAEDDQFGYSLALSADASTLVVGAWVDSFNGLTRAGSVYIMDRVGDTYDFANARKINAFDPKNFQFFGRSVALSADGSTLVVGASQDTTNGLGASGSVYVMDRVGDTYDVANARKVTPSDAAALDYFGTSVALSADGSTLAIGAVQDDNNTITDTGSVYIMDRLGNTYDPSTARKVYASDFATGDAFGVSVALSADASTLAVGSYLDDDAAINSGSVYIMDRLGDTYDSVSARKITAFDADVQDLFGLSVALTADASTLVVGTNLDDDNGVNTGSIYVMDRIGSTYDFLNARKVTAYIPTTFIYQRGTADLQDFTDVIDLGVEIPFIPFLAIDAVDCDPFVEFTWALEGEDFGPFVSEGQAIRARYFKYKVTFTVTGPNPRVYNIRTIFSGSAILQRFNDLNVATQVFPVKLGTGRIRLPIKEDFAKITQVSVSLQGVSLGTTWTLVSKEITDTGNGLILGPEIQIYEIQPGGETIPAEPIIDVTVRGV